jgi:hypothetical protein
VYVYYIIIGEQSYIGVEKLLELIQVKLEISYLIIINLHFTQKVFSVNSAGPR